MSGETKTSNGEGAKMSGYTHRVVYYHTLRKGALAGVTVRGDFRVCSAEDAEAAVATMKSSTTLDVVETSIEVL